LTPGETGIAIPFLFPLYRWIIRKTDGPPRCPEIGAEDNVVATAGQLALLSVTCVAMDSSKLTLTPIATPQCFVIAEPNFADLAGRARRR